jgi:hypothetical protein
MNRMTAVITLQICSGMDESDVQKDLNRAAHSLPHLMGVGDLHESAELVDVEIIHSRHIPGTFDHRS